MKPRELFFELIHVAVGSRDSLSEACPEKVWERAFKIAKKQTLQGVLYSAIERLPKDQCPPLEPIVRWWRASESAEKKYAQLDEAGKTAVAFFREHGFPCQILKGTSVARYYPQPERRLCGDVDLWLDGGRKKIYEFARSYDKDGMLYGVNYHHIHFHLIEDVEIEVHIYPSYLSSPFKNRRLHKFFDLYRPTMESDTPCLAFDRVFILLHCFSHITGHGVGLRQIMDYYYVLLQGFSEQEREESVEWIKSLGMGRFAKGMMWELQTVFAMAPEYLLMEPDEKEGRFILDEVMLTGNMGHGDKRKWGSTKSPLSRFFFNLRRDLYLARHYPSEALWQPFFSLWLYFWRLFHGLLKDREEE